MAEKTLLKLDKLTMHFKTSKGPVRAVDGVNFELGYNEAVVVVGESGCGKSSLAKAILRLLPRNIDRYEGKVLLDGNDIMTNLDLPPGPQVGIILNELLQSVLEDPALNEKESLLTIARKLVEQRLGGTRALHRGATEPPPEDGQ